MIQKPSELISAVRCTECNNEVAPFGSSKTICQPCYRKIHLKKKPNWYTKQLEKNNKRKRDLVRVKRGVDVNIPRVIARTGEGHITKAGYKSITVEKYKSKQNPKGRVLEHVYIMSEHLGRRLRDKETVHHKNGFRNDNRIENLELWSKSHGSGQRVEDKISWAKSFLEEYGYLVTVIGDKCFVES